MLSRKQQRKTIIIGYMLMIPLAVMIVLTALGIDVFAAFVPVDDKIHDVSAETPEKAVFEGQSGMPCENREQFEKWYENYCASSGSGEEREVNEEIKVSDASEASLEEERLVPEIPIYRFKVEPSEKQIDPEIQRAIYRALDEEEIAYWYTGALVQCYQESHGDPNAENPNGLDKGLYQYRVSFWDWNLGDIFDADVQIRLYAEQMAKRFNAGLSVDEAISRHNTSDYVTEVNWQYVADVKQWFGKMEVVE